MTARLAVTSSHVDKAIPVSAAAWIAAALLSLVAMFQVALALGAPYGEATMGGRADTVDGVLTNRYRVLASVSALVLVGLAAVVLIDDPAWPRWIVAAFLVINSIANFTAPHRLERWALGPVAAAAALATALAAGAA
jgi:hypothetical protein